MPGVDVEASSSANGGTVRGGAGGAESEGALRRKGLLEPKDGGWAMAEARKGLDVEAMRLHS
jgi:hypothetical protein